MKLRRLPKKQDADERSINAVSARWIRLETANELIVAEADLDEAIAGVEGEETVTLVVADETLIEVRDDHVHQASVVLPGILIHMFPVEVVEEAIQDGGHHLL